jgi:PST family polysaccharide transporter
VEEESGLQLEPAMGRKAAGGAIYVGGSQCVRALLSIVTTIVVARILSPADYGVIAMWAPIFSFVLLFQDFGFSAATIQARSLSQQQSNTLFWINVLASLAIAAILIASAPLVAAFFRDSRVGLVTAASASIALVGGLAIQLTALLNREMRFRALSAIVVTSALAGAATTIISAFWIRSYWALFLGSLAATLVQTALTWAVSHRRPSAQFSLAGSRSLLALGGHIATFGLLNFFARNADNVLIGRVWGPVQLGAYDRSYKLMIAPLQLINNPLSQVMLPVLSRLQGEPERYRKSYLLSVQAILLATAPVGAIAAAESDKLVPLLLGKQWTTAAPIFFWLALTIIYQPAAGSLGWLFISRGRGRAFATWGVVSTIITVASVIVGLRGGAEGVAQAYVVGNVIVTFLLIFRATGGSPVTAADILRLLFPLFAAAALSAALVRSVDSHFTPLVLFLLFVPVSYAIAVIATLLFGNGRTFLIELTTLAKRGTKKGSSTAEQPAEA